MKVVRDIVLRLMFYIRKIYVFQYDLPFLPERMKFEKVEKVVANLHDKEE